MQISAMLAFVLAASGALIFLILLGSLFYKRLQNKLAIQQQLIANLQDDLAALCESRVSLGMQVSDAMELLDILQKRQDQLEMQEPKQSSYRYAMKMAKQGAQAQDLVNDCGIALGEAELVLLASRMQQ